MLRNLLFFFFGESDVLLFSNFSGKQINGDPLDLYCINIHSKLVQFLYICQYRIEVVCMLSVNRFNSHLYLCNY